MCWESISVSFHRYASKASQTGTSLSPAAFMAGFLPPTSEKSRHEETPASPETLVLCIVPELKKKTKPKQTITLPNRDTEYGRIP